MSWWSESHFLSITFSVKIPWKKYLFSTPRVCCLTWVHVSHCTCHTGLRHCPLRHVPRPQSLSSRHSSSVRSAEATTHASYGEFSSWNTCQLYVCWYNAIKCLKPIRYYAVCSQKGRTVQHPLNSLLHGHFLLMFRDFWLDCSTLLRTPCSRWSLNKVFLHERSIRKILTPQKPTKCV